MVNVQYKKEGRIDSDTGQMDQSVKLNLHEDNAKCHDIFTESVDQPAGAAKQFEICWQYVNLLAKEYKLSKIITNSIPYKCLATLNPYKQADGSAIKSTKSRCILGGISGSVCSGQLTAILGPSGVGKTTLLNAITGQTDNLVGSGKVSLIGGELVKRLSVAYVPQVDILPEGLTTLEELQFASRLKNTANDFDHNKNINRLVKHLRMKNFLNTRIKNLSGGEAKRLSIGRELLGNSNVLILDEPTSGLDANTAKKVVMALRDILEYSESYLGRPMAIIITIHQPQRELLNLFHRCYVMAEGGRAIYEGPPSDIMSRLLSVSSLAQVCDTSNLNQNPAVVAIEVASGVYGSSLINELSTHHENQALSLTRTGQQANILRESKDKLNKQRGIRKGLVVDKRLEQSYSNEHNFKTHTLTLIKRNLLLAVRNRFLLGVRIIAYLLSGIAATSAFSESIDPKENICPAYKSEVDSLIDHIVTTKKRMSNASHIMSQIHHNSMFFYTIIQLVANVTVALISCSFPPKMQMFMREHKNGWYSSASFIVSQTLADFPMEMIGPVLVTITSYIGINQPDSPLHWRQIGCILVLLLVTLTCNSLAQMMGALFMNSIEMSVFIGCAFLAPFLLFSGIVISPEHMSFPIQYLNYGSFIKYAYESLVLLRFGYGMCPCDDTNISGYPVQASPEIVPERLNLLSSRLINGYQASHTNNTYAFETAINSEVQNTESSLILSFLRLTTAANNFFVSGQNQLGDCDTYRSLILFHSNIQDQILPQWLAMQVLILLITKYLVYLMIKLITKVDMSTLVHILS